MKLPDRIAFSLFGMDIYWYAVFICSGIILAVILTGIFAKKRNMQSDVALDLCLVAVPLGLICARLYYVLFNLESFHSFFDIINTRTGGLAIPGGIIGGLLGIGIYSLNRKRKIMSFLDVLAPGLALAQAIGRWGNFFNQEAYGIAITNPKLLYFPLTVRIEDCAFDGCTCEIAQHGHMATFFYESMACLIIFIVLTILFKKVKHNGDIFLIYGAAYSFERAIIEQFRTDSLMLGKLRITQVLCMVCFVVIIGIFIIRAIMEKKQGRVICPVFYEELPSEDAETGDGTDTVSEVAETGDGTDAVPEVAETGDGTVATENESEEKDDTDNN